jgi:hypothetical protein
MAAAIDWTAHRSRMTKAWAEKNVWQTYVREAQDFAIPYRRPTKNYGHDPRVDRIFDSTAIDSTFRGAGQLKEDIFPSGSSWFRLTPGALAKKLIKLANDNDVQPLKRELQNLTDQIVPYFQTGEFDLAVSEMCLDLFASTGILLPVRGDAQNPVRFFCIPADEVALTCDVYGRVNAMSWQRDWTKRDLKNEFPGATWPQNFMPEGEEGLDQTASLYQEFVRQPDGRWLCLARLDQGDNTPLRTWWRKAQPFVAARYHVVPGEAYGRGPIMLALPTIKVLNKVQEMTLRNAAISLLGLWGYRPGGAFNPEIHRMRPGAFWPVNATGGMMGPDVARLDNPARGGLDTAQIVIPDLRAIIQRLLHDDPTPGKGKTPVSAEEILLHIQKVKQAYMGAFGRLISEIIPILIPAVAEILYEQKLLATPIKIDQLLLGIEVTSPLAAALKADHIQPLIQFIQVVAAFGQKVDRWVPDSAIAEIAEMIGVQPRLVTTEAERKAYDEKAAAAQAAQFAAEMAIKNPEAMGLGGGDQAAVDGGNVVPMRGAA